MPSPLQSVRARTMLVSILFASLLGSAVVAASRTAPIIDVPTEPGAGSAENRNTSRTFRWNLSDRQLPLISLPEHITGDLDSAFAYPIDNSLLPLFQSLYHNRKADKYLLMLTNRGTRQAEFVEFTRQGSGNYASNGVSRIQLADQGTATLLRAADNSEYRFERVADGELRCVRIAGQTGTLIQLTYRSDGLIETLTDTSGRLIRFNYESDYIKSVTQIWSVDAVKTTRTWMVSSEADPVEARVSYSHAPGFGTTKNVPRNALKPNYTAEMAASDRTLAAIFGGPEAVAAANSFEPAGLANQYPVYRGDLIGDDGAIHPGHLSYAMHLYGSIDGTKECSLYVPAGFTSHSSGPTPTDAAVTFFYPRLGNLTNVTLAVFHIANFRISNEGGRIRIGNIGGPGGSYPFYKHSHIEFYRGNTGLPSSQLRQHLRINPADVFSSVVAQRR